MSNPLLSTETFPLFEKINPEHAVPALEQVLNENRVEIDALCRSSLAPNWSNFIEPMETLNEKIEQVWSPVSYISSVRDSDAWRDEVEKALPLLSAYSSEVGQNHALYSKFKSLAGSPEFSKWPVAQRQTIGNEIRDFELSGVALNEQDKQRYTEISAELAKLSHQYEQNVLDATQGWALLISDKAQLAGLPEQVIEAAKQNAQEAGEKGWRFTLQAPSYIPLMTYADDRDLREKMYTAFVTRASDQGPNRGQWDNTETMHDIIKLRQEKAVLLGMSSYADYSLQTKMADSVAEVESFLLDLAKRSKAAAQVEWQTLQDFAANLSDGAANEKLEAWDAGYYAEKLKQATFDFSEEDLKPYFPLNKALEGLFEVVKRVFGMQVIDAKRPETWHEDVQFFEIRDADDKRRGWFYLDLYAREHKQGGAWMADCTNRRKTEGKLQNPIAFLTCNFAKPVGDQPSLLRHDDVVTLFHEFGHGLHHMLTQVDVSSVAGISGVPWDAVELPSQFLENWCWQREALDFISGHVETGEAIPDELLQKRLASKNFQAAMQMLRQIEFSLFDLRMHQSTDKNIDIQAVLNQVREEVAVIPAPSFNRFAHGFSHIFAGGYAAGYYSYKWAEVLSADAFSRFEEEGIFNAQTGQDFLHHILEKGGSESPMVLFERFRGRKPEVKALLIQSGLI
ncbi:MAG: M3 family metallopeptidase [Arenicellales bacterium]